MLGIFRRRKALENGAVLLGHLDRQVDAIWQAHGFAVPPILRSFFFHDYMTGLFTAAERSGHLSRRAAKRAYTGYMQQKFGAPRSAAVSCYRVSRGHCRGNPHEKAFRDGLADGHALLAQQPADTPLIRQFEMEKMKDATVVGRFWPVAGSAD
ncbi:MAG: hypothetical protein RLO15_04915 [Parvibaculum sp.]